jgi:hypothetical protein
MRDPLTAFGFILPLLVYYLILIVNSTEIIPKEFRHSNIYNGVLLLILGSVLIIGLNNIAKAAMSGFTIQFEHHLIVVGAITLAILALAATKIFKKTY